MTGTPTPALKRQVNHNQRALAQGRDAGYFAEIVERWDSFSHRRHDFAGFIDMVLVGHGQTIGVQMTSRSGMSARRKKILESENFAAINEQWRIEVWGYWKNSGRYQVIRKEVNAWERIDGPIEAPVTPPN